MSPKTVLFGSGLFICIAGAPFLPILGIIGYVLHHNLGPEEQWWASPINRLEIRYSYTLAIVTAVGLALNWSKLRFGKSLLISQEKLAVLFLGVIWLSVFIGGDTVGRYTVTDHPSVKMTKILVFCLMMSHIVTNTKRLDWLFWTFVLGSLFLGWQAYETPRRAFIGGRLESVGGADFRNANTLGAYLAMIIPIIGVQFLRTDWRGKIFCAISGAFALNAIVLCRSRSALLGLVSGGIMMAVLIPSKHRSKVIVCLVLASIGFISLMDQQFIVRSKTVFRSEDTRDKSAQSRIEIWRAGVKMIKRKPLGVGAGNFHQSIGRYNPSLAYKDAHSTPIRCTCELGIHGFALLTIVLLNGFSLCRRTIQQAEKLPNKEGNDLQMMACAIVSSLFSLVVCGLTGSLVYLEALWWFLLLPCCVVRSLDNIKEDIVHVEAKSTANKIGKRVDKKSSFQAVKKVRIDG